MAHHDLKTLFKTDDIEVVQSERGWISFAYNSATDAMQGLYQRIAELEENTAKLQQENAVLKAQITEHDEGHDEGHAEQCMTVDQFMKERDPLAAANKALQFETQDQPAAQNTELRDEVEKYSHLQLVAKLQEAWPEGYQQVPIIPTDAMLDAVVADDQGDKNLLRTLAREQWNMMLEAARAKDKTEYLQSLPANNEPLQQAIEHILDGSDE
ncbi:MAG: hypothetical protein V7731_22430 [Amphritea sp.]